MIVLVATALAVFYLLLAVLSVVGPTRLRAKDRVAVLEGVADVAILLLLVRLVVPWTPATGWLWVAAVVVLGLVAVTPWARQEPEPLVAPASPTRRALRGAAVVLRVVVLGAVLAVTA
ncbi:MAG: hypothetical protein Q7T56_17880 [Nocardioidaceae bacterium]|nr:hypothetical protein [Nocardioidaceae bacterium]